MNRSILSVCLATLLFGSPLALATPQAAAGPPAPAAETGAHVTKVIDGDTIDVTIESAGGRRKERVRLLGIDAPEKARDDRPAEPLEREATAFARRLARGAQVVLTTDPGHEDRDRYGRLLRYVYLSDGRCLNVEMLKEGLARAYTRFRFSRSREFRALEKEARLAQRGIWAPP